MSDVLGRYASKEMVAHWSDDHRYKTWRQLWWTIAHIQNIHGVKSVSQDQVEALGEAVDAPIDYGKVAEYEKRFRHDVMAHIHALGDAVPEAREIIHLGCTSCDITDNADIILMRGALRLIRVKLGSVLVALIPLIQDWHNYPCLGYTHYQPAQPTTVGKRFAMWASDFMDDFRLLERSIDTMRLRGLKGATGTQASFMELIPPGGFGAMQQIKDWDHDFARELGFDDWYAVVGQTYPRKLDFQVTSVLASIAQSAHKFATDIRLLQHDGELEEPFEEEQVGSSAMAYKSNPMRCERICSLARFVMNLLSNTLDTAATQWLERTLDDSANRRLVIPQVFLVADGLLRTCLNVIQGIRVNKLRINANLNKYLPFMATEAILMRAVQAGRDRQKVHEIIREKSMAAKQHIRLGKKNNLLLMLGDALGDEIVKPFEIDARDFVGTAPEQCSRMVAYLRSYFDGWESSPETLEV